MRIAVVFQPDGQAAKPVYPPRTQMAFDPVLIDRWFTWIRFQVEFI